MAEIKSTTFAEDVGAEFAVLGEPGGVFSLTLTKIVQHSKTEHQEAFSLFFHGPRAPFLPQGIRKLRHAKLGELEIFLVPVGQDPDGFEYEAVFNYLSQA